MAVFHGTFSRHYKNFKKYGSGYLFVLPSILILSIFVLSPILQTAWMSLHEWVLTSPEHPFIGFENYLILLRDDRFWNALKNTAYYTIGVVPLRLALALGVALILNAKLKGRAFFRAMLFLPAIGSFAIEAIIWSFLLNPEIGLISYYSRMIGLPSSDWLRSTTWAMPAIIMVSIWRWFGFNMVVFLAGLQGISESLYEAANVDGASRLQRFWHITLPMLRPTALFVLVDAIISSFQVFDQVYVMTRGGPLFSTETMVTYIYHQGFGLFSMGYASSLAFVLFMIIFALTLIQLKSFRFRDAF
jgi:multiple sugar transport system permease protein